KAGTRHQRGLSLLEVLVVVATVALFIAFFLPLLVHPHRQTRARAERINCVNNLKQIGLAARIYANDHECRFPWMVSTNFNPTHTSGTLELTNSPQVFLHFRAMSNELNTPKLLHCRSDVTRSRTQDFDSLSNSNLSYFVGL